MRWARYGTACLTGLVLAICEQLLRESLSLLYRELPIIAKRNTACSPTYRFRKSAAFPLIRQQKRSILSLPSVTNRCIMLSAHNNTIAKASTAGFFRKRWICDNISVSLHQPEEVQKLVERSHAEEVIR